MEIRTTRVLRGGRNGSGPIVLRQQTSDAKRRVSVGEGLIEVANAMKHFRNAMAGVITQFSSALRPTTHNLMMLKSWLRRLLPLRETNLSDVELIDAVMAMKEPRISEVYLAVNQPSTRTIYIQRCVEKYQKSK